MTEQELRLQRIRAAIKRQRKAIEQVERLVNGSSPQATAEVDCEALLAICQAADEAVQTQAQIAADAVNTLSMLEMLAMDCWMTYSTECTV